MNEKMTWVSPKSTMQRFEANDSISACLYAICELPTGPNSTVDRVLGVPTCDLHWFQDHSYYKESNGLVHRECKCGAGTSFTGTDMTEKNNPAYISELWFDTDTTNDTYKDTLIYKAGEKDYDEEYISSFFSDTVTQLKAWWTTIYTGTFGYGDKYTHTGTVSFEGNSANHSG